MSYFGKSLSNVCDSDQYRKYIYKRIVSTVLEITTNHSVNYIHLTRYEYNFILAVLQLVPPGIGSSYSSTGSSYRSSTVTTLAALPFPI